MPKPVGNQPYEIFGHSTGEPVSEEKANHIKNQYCPFLERECTKFRKSEAHIKIGSCALGYKNRAVIICPERFNTSVVFETIENHYFLGKNVKWISEVSLGDRGSVDFVAAVPNRNRDLDEFLCVEFQANGTTGTPWNAVEYWRENHTLEGAPKTKYGFNWANELVKTMTQQILKKGSLLDEWGQKLVVVLQDSSMEYILKQGKGISKHHSDMPIQFQPFKLEYKQGSWVLVASDQLYSASMDGIIEVLTSERGKKIEKKDFEESILKRGQRQNVWNW